MKIGIIVSLHVIGMHAWEQCPLEEVKYLRDQHRHTFHFKATKSVTHDDRDIEIIMLKTSICDYLQNKYYDHTTRTHEFGNNSCEMLAKEIFDQFDLDYCEVLEDGENGGFVRASSE